MKRARAKGTPRIPQSYEEFIQLGEDRFQTDGQTHSVAVIGEGEHKALCFIVDPLKELIKNAREIHIDGTFKIVPSVPGSRQLMTIMAIESDHVSIFFGGLTLVVIITSLESDLLRGEIAFPGGGGWKKLSSPAMALLRRVLKIICHYYIEKLYSTIGLYSKIS